MNCFDRKGELQNGEDYNKKVVLTEWPRGEIDGTNDKALCNDNRRRLYS